MRRWLVVAIAGMALVAAGCRPMPGGPPDSPCAIAVQQIPADLYADAGWPGVVCENHGGPLPGEAGWFDGATIHADASTSRGYDPVPYFKAIIGHELGHAYANHQGFSMWPYADIRGLPHDLYLASEDYAETFSYAAGLWMPLGPPPYAFQNVAGVPTADQIARLRYAGLLP